VGDGGPVGDGGVVNDGGVVGDGGPYAATRAFFGQRAAGWDEQFPDDAPAYERAVAELAPPVGGTVLDAACGTGRAVPPLRRAVGPEGLVVAADVTHEMLEVLVARGRRPGAAPLLADVFRLPLPPVSLDAILAAGLISHLDDPVGGLAELARACRPGGRLALFHPIGRVALARRHGRVPDPDDIRSPHRLGPALSASGWKLESLDDGDERYLAVARRG
jgi:SAM-dependent methyltransferase